MTTADQVFEYAGAVYTKQRLTAEWNWNRFVRNLSRPGEVIMYRAPNETEEHPLYIDPNGNMVPVDASGQPIYANLDELRIAVGSDETKTTDADGNEVQVAPDGKIIPLADEGTFYTYVENGTTYVAYEDGTPVVSSITGKKIKPPDVMELRQQKLPVSVDNNPKSSSGVPYSEDASSGYFDYDKDLFPLESIIQSERPDKQGLLKAWAGDKSGQSWTQDWYYPGRWYTVSEDAKFKYWLSGTASSDTLNTNDTTAHNGYPISSVGVGVNYDRPLISNKIVIGIDTTVLDGDNNVPVWSRVYAEVDNGSGSPQWKMIAEDPAVDENGKIVLYYNGTDTWTQSSSDLSKSVNVMSLRYEVYKLKRPNTHFNLIEMSLRLERDLTDYLVSWSTDSTMTEHSFVAPMGTISSNTSSVVLSNLDGRFDSSNKFILNSDRLDGLHSGEYNEFYGIIDRHIKMRLDVAVSDEPFDDFMVPEWNRVFTMRTDTWTMGDGDATAELKDDSVILQELKPNPIFFEQFDRTVTAMEVIIGLLDSVGYTNVQINGDDYDKVMSMDYYWTDGETTVWDAISEICQSVQMAVYFDSYGVLQFQPLSTMYSQIADNPVILSTQDTPASGGDIRPSNIVSITKDGEYEANTINITYKKTHLSEVTPSGIEPLDAVWEPGGTQVLRASPLIEPLGNLPRHEQGSDYSLRISPQDVKSWPFAGIVNIDGELIRYNAKKYYYYDAGGKLKHEYVTSQKRVDELNKKNPRLAFKNAYNGRLRIQNRGLWNTYTKAHHVDINGYLCRYRWGTGQVREWKGGVRHDKNNSALLMRPPKNFNKQSSYAAMNGAMTDEMIHFFGTRMKYPKSGYSYGAAGIAIGLGSNDSGIYVELARTSAVSAEKRKQGHELKIMLKHRNGTWSRPDKGVAVAVSRAKWYDLDVYYNVSGNDCIVQVMVNGIGKHTWTIPIANDSRFDGLGGGRYGMFVRGDSHADFEYIYANNRPEQQELDEGSFWDRVDGEWQSQSETEYQLRHKTAWRYNRKKHVKYDYRYDQLFFDDFGPYVHEMREYNVKFEKAPAVFSKIYFSNDSQAVCTEYRHGPFGAYFMMGNASRNNAVLSGDDTLTYGAENSVTQRLIVFARAIQQDDESTLTIRDEGAVARRGEVALDINAAWVQSDDAAKQLGGYILDAWSQPSQSYSLEVFGDLRLALGQKVVFYAPEEGIGGDGLTTAEVESLNVYVINEVHHNFGTGLSTTVNIRSIRPDSPVA